MIKDILETMLDKMENNNLQAFKDYLESEDSTIDDHAKAIEYSYDLQMNVYNTNSDAGLVQVSPNQLLDDLGFSTMTQLSESFMGSNASSQNEVWNELPESETLREEEYELIEGHWPSAYNEVVLAVDENREITDYCAVCAGTDGSAGSGGDSFEALQEGGEVSLSDPTSYTPQELLGMEFQLVLSSDLYRNVNGIWIDMSEDEDFVQEAADNGETMRVVGIITPSEGSSKREVGGIYYTSALEEHVIEQAEASEIVKEQREHPDINVFTQTAFGEDEEFDITTLTPQQQMQFASMSQQELAQYMADYSENRNATYEGNLERLGVVDLDTPSSISIYANTFEDKEMISQLIERLQLTQQESGR